MDALVVPLLTFLAVGFAGEPEPVLDPEGTAVSAASDDAPPSTPGEQEAEEAPAPVDSPYEDLAALDVLEVEEDVPMSDTDKGSLEDIADGLSHAIRETETALEESKTRWKRRKVESSALALEVKTARLEHRATKFEAKAVRGAEAAAEAKAAVRAADEAYARAKHAQALGGRVEDVADERYDLYWYQLRVQRAKLAEVEARLAEDPPNDVTKLRKVRARTEARAARARSSLARAEQRLEREKESR